MANASVALRLYKVLTNLPSLSALDGLKDALSPEHPDDLEETKLSESVPIPEGIDRSACSYFNYDEAHSGRFSTFGTNGATIDPEHVVNRPNALDFIRSHLTYGSLETSNECVIFVQGLRTASQPEEKVPGMIASKRIECYSDTLFGTRIAQVHTGTNLDQPNAKVNVNDTLALRGLSLLCGAAGIDQGSADEDGNILVPPTALDIGQAVLSGRSVFDTPMKKTMRSLLRLASREKPLVLMVYSRGSIECNAALKEFIDEIGDKEKAFHHLRDGVTVVTLGTPTGGWPDGPAYIHVSSWEDVLSRIYCNANRNGSAGADAVFLHNHSPYPDSFDSHNFQGGTSQFLSVIMMMNKVSTFKELWEVGQSSAEGNGRVDRSMSQGLSVFESLLNNLKLCCGMRPSEVGGGNIVMPHNINELVDAMISITDGQKYLWNPEKSIAMARQLPSKEDAVKILKLNIGDDTKIDNMAASFKKRELET